MCGIAGIVTPRGGGPNREHLTNMIATLRHRGPDALGIHMGNGVGLAHARLSIVDIEGGSQPMSFCDGRMWIVFNGEIFNWVELREELLQKGHTFTTHSDTEVILHLYQEEGEGCVHRLNGQWALAIWDESRRRLFLSRDRMGVRPLFYTQQQDRFLFASEVKALLASTYVDPVLDVHALDQIFTFWVALPPRTIFKNVCQLPPGHSLIVENGQVRIWEYWNVEYGPEDDRTEEGEQRLTEELLALMLDATRIRLRCDVPVAAFLSGGLDSTFSTALMKSLLGDRIQTFSVRFNDREFDESDYQEQASAALRTKHSHVSCGCEDIGRIFRTVIWHTEQPILRTAPAPLYMLSQLVRAEGFKVVVTGEGADETMGGYDIFKEAKIRRFCCREPHSHLRPVLLKRLYPYVRDIQRQPSAYLRTFFDLTPEALASPFFSHLPRWNLTRKLNMFLSDEVRGEIRLCDRFAELERCLPAAYKSWSGFNQAEYLEIKYLLPGYILSSQGDRMAMAHSVECRHPFLDYRVVEFAAKIPPRLKMKVLDQKYLLKRAATGLVPTSIEKRFKQPYRAPGAKSFFASRQDYAQELLDSESIKKYGIFNPTTVGALVAKLGTGRATSAKEDMALVGILSTQILLHEFSRMSTDLPDGTTKCLRSVSSSVPVHAMANFSPAGNCSAPLAQGPGCREQT